MQKLIFLRIGLVLNLLEDAVGRLAKENELLHDFSSLIKSRDTDDHICHCMSTQKVHRSIVKMNVKF